jgi:hypothetical protein
MVVSCLSYEVLNCWLCIDKSLDQGQIQEINSKPAIGLQGRKYRRHSQHRAHKQGGTEWQPPLENLPNPETYKYRHRFETQCPTLKDTTGSGVGSADLDG